MRRPPEDTQTNCGVVVTDNDKELGRDRDKIPSGGQRASSSSFFYNQGMYASCSSQLPPCAMT
jgi:hypothetical protein